MIEPDPKRPVGQRDDASPPAFNAPGVVLACIVAIVLVHALRSTLLGPSEDAGILLDFAFIPGRYLAAYEGMQGAGGWPLLWTPVSHALLHGDWAHLAANSVWMLAFGGPVARRLGSLRFLGFSVVGAIAGAALFALFHPTLLEPVVGASGVVSALMGGACRFAFGALGRPGIQDMANVRLLSVRQALSNRTVLFFIAIFFATNLILGSGLADFTGSGGEVAWEAHLGGFLFGFLLFGPFDAKRHRASASR